MPPMPLSDEEIFQAARRIESTEARWAYLNHACGDDVELRRRVEALLNALESSESFLESPAPPLAAERPTALLPVTEKPGETLGHYKLLQQIGEGGMGIVYMAQQTEPIERRVALKIIKPGMDTRQVIVRFEVERQALAMMDHPNIAKALDAGVTDGGRPYFVMELVKGIPITEYCDKHQLTTSERLELFVPVCQAIQHAHQKGIIHRDIKPSNVMVARYDDQPIPKVIDFGVAKAVDKQLTQKTMFTEFGQVLGTFEYMSPEQASFNQWDVDTRTDIYSLGVLLYELLAGETPFDRQRFRSEAIDDILRIIREEDPPKPSTRLSRSQRLPIIAQHRRTDPKQLGTVIRGELDWIAMKALEKDRTRRYETVNGFRMDIQCHLQGDPVTAAPPSAGYRLRKLSKRHRVAFAVSLLVASALLLGILGTSSGMVWALSEKRRAAAEEDKAEAAREEAEYSRYTSNIPAANFFLVNNAPSSASSILKSAPAKHRNWEWGYLAGRTWPQYRIRLDSIESSMPSSASANQFWKSEAARVVQSIRPWDEKAGLYGGFFSPDARSLFFYHAKGEIKKFSAEYGEQLAVYSSDLDNPITAAINSRGTKIASFPFSNRAIICDVLTEEVIASGRDDLEKSPPWICRWTPDEKYLVTGHMDGSIRIWDAQSESLNLVSEWQGHKKNTLDVFIPISNDAVWSASNDGTIRKWTVPGGLPLGEYRIPVDGEVEYQAIAPSGKLAFAILRDGANLIWEIETEKIFAELSGPDSDPYQGPPRFACAFSPDGTCLAAMTGKLGITIYDVTSGDVLNQVSGHGVPLRGMQFSPDGRMLLTVSEDGIAKIWSCVRDDSSDAFKAHEDVVYQIDIDSAGAMLLLGSYDATASIWNLRSNKRQAIYRQHGAEIVAVDLDSTGRHAATLDAEGVIHVWDTATANQLFSIDPQSNEFSSHLGGAGGGLRSNVLNFPAVLSTGIFTPDGKRLVAFQKDSMKTFNAKTGRIEVVLEGASSSGWPVYSHDSSLVAVLEMNARGAGVWDIRTGKRLHRLRHGKPLVMIDFSPVDHRLVTCSMGSEIIIWDGNTAAKLHTLNEPAGSVTTCRFSKDGQFVLAGYGDSAVRIWDTSSGRLVTTLRGHSERIRDVRFNPDQSRLLTWAMDDRAIIWDTAEPSANQLVVLGGKSKLLQAHWTPDGRDIVTAWSDGTIDVWRGASREDLSSLTVGQGTFVEDFGLWRDQHMNTVSN
jgi:WD40 repeat protein/serine/threonine protein kinase